MSKVTIHALREMKSKGERITMLTAYDATFARLFDESGVDALLVGDSLGMVIQGHDTTLPVTVEDILYHVRAVRRGTKRAHIVADLPFMSYQVTAEEALRNAGRLIAEGGAEAVKLEGGAEFADVVRKLVRAGIPVMGHLGLTPQSVHAMGGFRVQGRDEATARKLVSDALALEKAGIYALVLEGIPVELSSEITRRLSIPTIGIGAGVECDGQVLVSYDLLGLNPKFKPKFVKHYLSGEALAFEAVRGFVSEVKKSEFPTKEHSFHSPGLRLFPTLSTSPLNGLAEHDEAEAKLGRAVGTRA